MHLILGAGHMGRKHGKILKDLGEEVWYADTDLNKKPTEWIPEWKGIDNFFKERDWKEIRSVLICTPAETHAELINKIPPKVPIFCEKPLLTNLKQKIRPRTGHFLLACNWTWCKCIKKTKNLCIAYPGANWLDGIHFALLPQLDVSLFNMMERKSFADFKLIHKEECDMFIEQMKHWLKVLAGKEKSRLNLKKAIKLNERLIKDEKKYKPRWNAQFISYSH